MLSKMTSQHSQISLLNAICQTYQLGNYLGQSSACSGGLLHQVQRFETTTGSFICKQINPLVIDQASIHRQTETIANALRSSVSVVCALKHDQDVLFYFEDQVVSIYPWVDGSILKQQFISSYHVEAMGAALARIHQAHLSLQDVPAVQAYQFESMQNFCCADVASLFKDSHIYIEKILQCYQDKKDTLQNHLVISHRDCDPKNVLWDCNRQYYIIDWESAGLINLTKDVITTAVYWSLDEKFKIDVMRLETFIEAYRNNGGNIYDDELEAGFYGLLMDWLAWLDFNLLRINKNSVDSREYKIGIQEAQNTLSALPIVLNQFSVIKKVV